MAGRVGSDDLTLVTTAILISRKTGGNVTEIFDKISETIRGRMKIERKVKSLTAQGRMQGILIVDNNQQFFHVFHPPVKNDVGAILL